LAKLPDAEHLNGTGDHWRSAAGFLIFVTDRNLFWQNRAVYLISSVLVNIIRSVPFVILLVLLLPLTQFLLGNTIGNRLPHRCRCPWRRLPLRLVDALREVDKGIIEAAEAFGAVYAYHLHGAAARSLRGSVARFDDYAGEPGYSAMAGLSVAAASVIWPSATATIAGNAGDGGNGYRADRCGRCRCWATAGGACG
jgi:hypothetical protein